MSDLFRCRASTWSAGAVPVSADQHSNEQDPGSRGIGFDYGDCAASVSASATAAAAAAAALALHSANTTVSPIDQPGSTSASFHYSPTDLASQEFSINNNNPRRNPAVEKAPSESASEYAQNFFTSSPPRSSRDWNTGNGSFATSNFSVLSVAASASSPFGHLADNGGANGSLLTPYGNSSPYTNGSCSAQQQPSQTGLHSGSPSSVGSQLSSMMSGGLNSNTSAATPTTPSAAGGGTSGPAAKRPARRNPWGSETYSDLIAKAIESYPEKQATLQQIYDYISTNYTYFRERSDPPASAGWKNSIRHNLSLHDKFVKCPKASESSKSSYWRLNANSLNRPYVRRRTCSLDTPGGGGGNGASGGKKAKSRLGSSGAALGSSSNAVSTAKRSAQMGTGGGRVDLKSGMYGGGDDLLAGLDGHVSATAMRSHLNSLSSGIASAFSIPGGNGGSGDTLLGLKGDPTGVGLNHHHPWANSGFLTDRKMANDELSTLCKMHASDSVSSSSLSLMSSGGGLGGGGGGAYEFQMPRVPPSNSTRSSFSSSGIGSERGSSSFFSPPPLPPSANRYHIQHSHFSHDQQQRYGSAVCETPPNPNQTNPANNTYDQLTGVLTGSAECLEGGSEDPFLRENSHQLMGHHHHHQGLHQHVQHHPSAPQINSHLHNLLMCGDSVPSTTASGIGSDMAPQHHQHQQQQPHLSSQDDMELRISLEIANRVKSGEMSSTMQQWAAAAASAARTVENGV